MQTLQELHGEDENMIKAKESATKKLDLELQALAGVSISSSTVGKTPIKQNPRSRTGENGGNNEITVTSDGATDDKERKKSKRTDRRSAPSSVKEKKEPLAASLNKDEKEDSTVASSKKEKENKDKDEGKKKDKEDSNLLSSLLKPGKKRERSIRQKREPRGSGSD